MHGWCQIIYNMLLLKILHDVLKSDLLHFLVCLCTMVSGNVVGSLCVGFHLFLQDDYSHVPDEETKAER